MYAQAEQELRNRVEQGREAEYVRVSSVQVLFSRTLGVFFSSYRLSEREVKFFYYQKLRSSEVRPRTSAAPVLSSADPQQRSAGAEVGQASGSSDVVTSRGYTIHPPYPPYTNVRYTLTSLYSFTYDSIGERW
jgi:hypothetical protein